MLAFPLCFYVGKQTFPSERSALFCLRRWKSMKEMEEKILREAEILPGNILKVGGFLNQQLDVAFLLRMGREIAGTFLSTGVTKVLTVETSGIPLAFTVAQALGVNAAYAKKHASANLSGDTYSAEVYSYTHGKTYTILLSRDYLREGDRVLIVDDFLACGNAVRGLMSIAQQAGATVVGVAAAVEKGFQGGGDELRQRGLPVCSLAVIDEFTAEGGIRFRAC